MNRQFKLYLVLWTVFFVLFNILVLVGAGGLISDAKIIGVFWIGYLFVNLSFCGQLLCSYLALKTDNLTKTFYRLPILMTSCCGLIVSVIVGTICMLSSGISVWIGIVVCVAVLAFNVVSVVKAQTAAQLVEETDNRIKDQNSLIKSLTAEVQAILHTPESTELQREIEKVYEALRYSDPVSHTALSALESQIAEKTASFTEAVLQNEYNTAKACADEITALLKIRNAKCVLLK